MTFIIVSYFNVKFTTFIQQKQKHPYHN